MSVSIGMIVMMLLIAVSPASAISDEAFDRVRLLEGMHCTPGRPQPQGDLPIHVWQREMRLCKKYSFKIDKIRRRCEWHLPENSYACAQLVRFHDIKRYPPSDPRKRM